MALIYIVEDDKDIREIETIALKNSNYNIWACSNASALFDKLDDIIPDLILLDIMLPDKDGYEIIKQIRQGGRTKNIPVIMVTAKTTEIDMIRGLDGGADDYICKPFSVMELLSRVKALLRRTKKDDPEEFEVGAIILNDGSHKVTVDGEVITLTFKEYEMLRYFMINRGNVLSREKLMSFVWGTDYAGESRTVDMHVKTLRQKLGEHGKLIKTVRNVGYVLNENDE